MTLEEARRQIDALDLEIRDLLMRRMDMSRAVAEYKKRSGDTSVYRPEREREILSLLGKDVPEERRDAYLAVVRRILQGSRAYQYSLFLDWLPGLSEEIFRGLRIPEMCAGVRLSLKCPDRPGALAAVLSLPADAGCDLRQISQTGTDGEYAAFEMTILCDLNRTEARKLLYQMSMESRELEILEVFGPEEEKA